jgi:dTDP-4-dehydrorhamnose 3,5-epimerase
MKCSKTGLDGLLVLEPRRFDDQRGFFLESFQQARYQDLGILDEFKQENLSRSLKGVLRGLHFQVKYPQAQIVTVIRGRIFDVAVDLRPGSKTFDRWFGTELSEDGPQQIYMAPGFAHGFYVLSDFADLHYKVSRIYNHGDEGGVRWNDPHIAIRWPIESPIVSERDAGYPLLRDLDREHLPHAD